LTVAPIALGPSLDLRHLVRIDQQHRKAPALEALTQRDPIAPRRFQGHARDSAGHSPVGHGFSVDGIRAKAAHWLGVVTGGHRHIMRCSPHVDTCRVQVDGGQWGWQSRRGATLWRLPVGHRCLHAHRGDRPWPWGRERRSCSPLPNGIRAWPLTTDVATGSRDQPHQRAHSTSGPTASHGPRPWRQYTAGCAPVPSRCTAAQRHKHPHKGWAVCALYRRTRLLHVPSEPFDYSPVALGSVQRQAVVVVGVDDQLIRLAEFMQSIGQSPRPTHRL
jgi:hypothetical protein